MNKIYDINSDQLKCSFCTNYFKCTMDFANIQRYSLKACPKCFANFTYSVLHPTTYQIFKVLLFETGIIIPLNSEVQLNSYGQDFKLQLNQMQQDLNTKVSLYFEQKMKEMMRQMNKIKQNMSESFLAIENQYRSITDTLSDKMKEINCKIQGLRNYDINRIIEEKGKLFSRQYNKNKDLLLKSNKKLFGFNLQKENIPQNSNVSKSIRSKCGLSSSSSSSHLLSSRSQSKIFDKSRINRSIIKSIKLDIQNNLDQSCSVHYSFDQKQKDQITKLLQEKTTFETYMPRQVVKSLNVLLKGEGTRNITESILQMKNKTVFNGELIELIGGDATKTNFGCYLKTLKQCKQVKTLRMIRCSLVDADMDHLLNFLSQHIQVETLIITNNRLSQLSIDALIKFKERHPESRLSNVYMGNNRINGLKASNILKRQYGLSLTINI